MRWIFAQLKMIKKTILTTVSASKFVRTPAAVLLIAFICALSSGLTLSAGAAEINNVPPESFIQGVTLQKQTVVDTYGLRVTAERLEITQEEDNRFRNVSVIFLVENHSPADVNLMIPSSRYVNNQRVGGSDTMIDIPKGESRLLPLVTFEPSSLAMAGIQYIKSIEIMFIYRIGELGDNSYPSSYNMFTMETTTERTDDAVIHFANTCIYEGDGIRFSVVTEEIINKYSGKRFYLLVENNSP